MYALLPMKEHSERIPEKNFRLLNDKPFFFYIADTLKATGLFTKLVIDTDGKLIEDLAKERYGDWVVIIQRPEELCGDYVAMNEIIAHDINILGIENDFMQTHSTNPFLTSKTIQKATEMYLSGKSSGAFDSLFSANELKTRLYDKDMAPLNHSPAELIRTQDLETIYEENSNFYFFSGEVFQKNNHRIGLKPQVYPMNRSAIETLDVDNQSDWNLAESLLKADASIV
jgi:CMP-N-acetylneuraminic acid synthetase